MATKRARATKKAEATNDSLLEALRFINPAQRETGNVAQTHCILSHGWAAATDGILTMGHKIQDDLAASPQTARLIAALSKCKDGVAITQLNEQTISVKSGKFTAKIPCVDVESIPLYWADPIIAPIDERFTTACRTIGHLSVDNAATVGLASMLGCGGSLFATNNFVIAEYWHGLELPPYWVMPKAAIAVLLKIEKKLVGFGFSGKSATFHFEDESFLKTQLYAEKWPNAARAFETMPADALLVPEHFFEGVNALADFADKSVIVCLENKLMAPAQDTDASDYEVPGLLPGCAFRPKQLQQIESLAKKMDFTSSDRMAYFYGENVRGCIAKIKEF